MDFSGVHVPLLVKYRTKGLKGYRNITRSSKYGNPHPIGYCNTCLTTHDRETSLWAHANDLVGMDIFRLRTFLSGLVQKSALGVSCAGYYTVPQNMEIDTSQYTSIELREKLILERRDPKLADPCHGETLIALIKIFKHIDHNKLQVEQISLKKEDKHRKNTIHRMHFVAQGIDLVFRCVCIKQ